jgi:hypothetical protein
MFIVVSRDADAANLSEPHGWLRVACLPQCSLARVGGFGEKRKSMDPEHLSLHRSSVSGLSLIFQSLRTINHAENRCPPHTSVPPNLARVCEP